MIKIHCKFNNFFIVENDTCICMCTQSVVAKRIKDALENLEALKPAHNKQIAPYCPGCGGMRDQFTGDFIHSPDCKV